MGVEINNLDFAKLCNTFVDMVNLVASPTQGNRILDVLITNLHTDYEKATVFPPIQPDNPRNGSPSEHCVAVAPLNLDRSDRTGFARKEVRMRRCALGSNLALLGLFLDTFN